MKKSARRTKSHAVSGKKKGASRTSAAAATKLKKRAARKPPAVRRARGAQLQKQKKKKHHRQQPRKQAGSKKPSQAAAPLLPSSSPSSSSPAAAGAGSRTTAKSAAVVRIMGHGQFVVDAKTLRRLNDIDDSLVDMVEAEVAAPAAADDARFKKSLDQLGELVKKHGKKVEQGEIVRSDIILPSADMPVDEAKKLFRGEGVVPEP